MKSMRKAGIALLTCSMYLVSGCVSSYFLEKWQDSTFHSSPLNRLLVIYVTDNAVQRRMWENAFTGALAAHTFSAVSSYGFFPDALPEVTRLAELIKTNGFNGMVVILNGRHSDTHFQEKSATKQSMHEDHRRKRHSLFLNDVHHTEKNTYWKRYRTIYRQMNRPEYIDTLAVGLHTIDVITTGKSARLIWSATSKTPEPYSESFIQGEVAHLVINELVEQQVIGFDN